VLEWAGHTEEAIAAYARVVHLDPTLSQSAFWSTTAQRQVLRQRVLKASGLSSCELGRYAALYGSDTAELRSLTDACRASLRTATDRTSLAMMLEASGLHGQALAEAEEAARTSGGSPEAQTALGFILAEDDVPGSRRHFIAGDHDAPLLLALTYFSGDTAASGPPSGVLRQLEPLSNGRSYGRSYYRVVLRRSAPEVVLIPGDWQGLRSPRTSQAAAILDRYPLEDSGTRVFEALLVPPAMVAYPGFAAALLAAAVLLLALVRIRDRPR
jgi:hypothetical protein